MCNERLYQYSEFIYVFSNKKDKFNYDSCIDKNTNCLLDMYSHILSHSNERTPLLNCSYHINNIHSFHEINIGIQNINIQNYNYYWYHLTEFEELISSQDYSNSNKKLYCASLDGKYKDKNGKEKNVPSNYFISNIACSLSNEISLSKCDKNCPDSLDSFKKEIQSISDLMNSVDSSLSLLDENVLKNINCNVLNSKIKQFKESVCYNYISKEILLIVGIIGFNIGLWILYVFSLFAIHRFNKQNYLIFH